MSVEWEPPYDGAPNQVIQGNGFFLSYNPQAGDGMSGLVARVLTSITGKEYGDRVEETALRIDHPDGSRTWCVLDGDFREEYTEALSGGIASVLEVYNRHKAAHRSNWSTD